MRQEVLKKNILSFCLHKALIKCRVSIRKSSIWTLQYSRRNIMEKKYPRPRYVFAKETFSIYFEHNRNSIES